MRRFRAVLPALVILVILTMIAGVGCQKNVTPHPNQLSSLDGTAYDSLLVAQAALSQAKADVAAGKIPAAAKPMLNTAIVAYNTARADWLIYRDVAQGFQTGDATALSAKLQVDLAALTTAIAQIQKLTGVTP